MTRVTGHVHAGAGWPVAGARVTALDPRGRQLGTATSAGDGAFELDGIPAGAATLLVAAPGHAPHVHTITVPGGARVDLGVIRLGLTDAGRLPSPGVWDIDPAHTTVQATARHLGISTVRGGFTEFSGTITVDAEPAASTCVVEMVAASVNTHNATRDAHLRSADFLDAATHPVVRYVSRGLSSRGNNWVVLGELTMAGTTRRVDLAMSYHGSGPDPWGGTRAGFSATTELRREDFAMNWNQAVRLGMDLVGTSLRVELEVEAVLRAG